MAFKHVVRVEFFGQVALTLPDRSDHLTIEREDGTCQGQYGACYVALHRGVHEWTIRESLACAVHSPEKARHFNAIRRISCGCCAANGPAYRCVCRMHMDFSRGDRPRVCAFHSLSGQLEYLRV